MLLAAESTLPSPDPPNESSPSSPPSSSSPDPPPFNYSLFCWSVVVIVNAIKFQHDSAIQGDTLVSYLQKHNTIPKLYQSWLANKDQNLQGAYTAALVHCCRCPWAFDELVKLKFVGMIEEGLKYVIPQFTNLSSWAYHS